MYKVPRLTMYRAFQNDENTILGTTLVAEFPTSAFHCPLLQAEAASFPCCQKSRDGRTGKPKRIYMNYVDPKMQAYKSS